MKFVEEEFKIQSEYGTSYLSSSKQERAPPHWQINCVCTLSFKKRHSQKHLCHSRLANSAGLWISRPLLGPCLALAWPLFVSVRSICTNLAKAHHNLQTVGSYPFWTGGVPSLWYNLLTEGPSSRLASCFDFEEILTTSTYKHDIHHQPLWANPCHGRHSAPFGEPVATIPSAAIHRRDRGRRVLQRSEWGE